MIRLLRQINIISRLKPNLTEPNRPNNVFRTLAFSGNRPSRGVWISQPFTPFENGLLLDCFSQADGAQLPQVQERGRPMDHFGIILA